MEGNFAEDGENKLRADPQQIWPLTDEPRLLVVRIIIKAFSLVVVNSHDKHAGNYAAYVEAHWKYAVAAVLRVIPVLVSAVSDAEGRFAAVASACYPRAAHALRAHYARVFALDVAPGVSPRR